MSEIEKYIKNVKKGKEGIFMKKRLMALIMVSSMLAAALAGCGNNSAGGTQPQGGAGTAATGGAKTLRVSWWGNDDRHSATIAALEKYQELNEGVTLNGEYGGFGNIIEKITTQIAGKTESDVMQINFDWLPKFSKTGEGFYDLYQLKDIIDLSQYDEEFIKLGEINGKLNAIPHGQNTQVIVINKSAFERLGLEVPDTWEGFVEAAKSFPNGSFPIVCPTPRFMIDIYLQQLTGKAPLLEDGTYNYSADELKAGFEWYKGMADAGVFVTRQDYLENVGNNPVSVAQNAKFINGQYAGVLEWTGGLASYEATLKEQGDELIIISMPKIVGAKSGATIKKPTMLFGISVNTKEVNEAANVINFLINEPEGVKIMGITRGVPASKAAVEVLSADGKLEGIVSAAYEYGITAEAFPEQPIYEDATLVDAYHEPLERLELGEDDLETAAKDAYDKILSALEKLK